MQALPIKHNAQALAYGDPAHCGSRKGATARRIHDGGRECTDRAAAGIGSIASARNPVRTGGAAYRDLHLAACRHCQALGVTERRRDLLGERRIAKAALSNARNHDGSQNA